MQRAQTILLVIVGIVIVVGAVLHNLLFPLLPFPEWLSVAVATIVGYLFGKEKDQIRSAFLGSKE